MKNLLIVAMMFGDLLIGEEPTSVATSQTPPGSHMLIGVDVVKTKLPQYSILWFTDPSWCAPCARLAPTINRMAAAGYPITTLKLDTIQAQQLNIRQIPVMVVLRDGQEVTRAVGNLPEADLRATYNNAVNNIIPTTRPR